MGLTVRNSAVEAVTIYVTLKRVNVYVNSGGLGTLV